MNDDDDHEEDEEEEEEEESEEEEEEEEDDEAEAERRFEEELRREMEAAAARRRQEQGPRGWITKVARLLTKPRLGAVGRSAARAFAQVRLHHPSVGSAPRGVRPRPPRPHRHGVGARGGGWPHHRERIGGPHGAPVGAGGAAAPRAAALVVPIPAPAFAVA